VVVVRTRTMHLTLLVKLACCVSERACLATLATNRYPQNFDGSAGMVVVVQHAAQPQPALDLTHVAEMVRLWTDELVRQA
jgi:hypothetical protein